MDFNTFSLIYPNEELRKKHDSGECVPDIDLFTLQELGLLEVFNLKNRDLSEFFTMDAEVIRYRIDSWFSEAKTAQLQSRGRACFVRSVWTSEDRNVAKAIHVSNSLLYFLLLTPVLSPSPS